MESIVSNFLLPSGLIFVSITLGAILIFVRKTKSIGFYLLLFGAILYVFFGTGPVSFWLLGNLEYKYPAVKLSDVSNPAPTIVVLAAYAEKDRNRPISSNVNGSATFRLIEAAMLFHKNPESKVIVSGLAEMPLVMKQILVGIGIDADKIMIENQSASTYESALNLKGRLEQSDFFLVTSAGHMPRAIGAFRKIGLNPIPAPTDYMSRKNFMAIGYLPSPRHLYYSDLAVHEYLGILYYKLTNRL